MNKVELIKKSGLFDENYYLETYPDVKDYLEKHHGVPSDTIAHYLKFGAKELRNPSKKFNTHYYLETYPDVERSGLNPLLHYILHGHKEGRRPCKPNYFLTMAACIKDEALYLDEWISYYIYQGVEHFYLNNDGSSDHTEQVLAPYMENGYVTLYNNLRQEGVLQQEFYNKIIEEKKYEALWCCFFDVDEFFQGETLLTDLLVSLDKDVSGLELSWKIYGDSFLETYDNRFVVERFVHHLEHRLGAKWYVKSICKLIDTKTSLSTLIHAFDYARGKVVNGQLEDISQFPVNTRIVGMPVNWDNFWINHYQFKSKEEYWNKIEKGDAVQKEYTKKKNYFNPLENNKIFDDSMHKYIPFIAQTMFEITGKIYNPDIKP